MNGIESKGWDGRTYCLVSKQGMPVARGDIVLDRSNIQHIIDGGRAPQHSASTGKVWTDHGEYYPSVFELAWHSDEPAKINRVVWIESKAFDQDKLHQVARLMQAQGGGFAWAIAEAYFRGDLVNRQRIVDAFPHLFLNFLEALEAAEAPAPAPVNPPLAGPDQVEGGLPAQS